jgi:hypothetical protein
MTKQELIEGINIALNDSIRRWWKVNDTGYRHFDTPIIDMMKVDDLAAAEIAKLGELFITEAKPAKRK